MAIEDAPVIEVLSFDEIEAYNPDRPISSLIRTQLLHLHHAENIVVPPRFRTNININNLLTERQASDYIDKITVLLHRYGEAGKASSSTKKGQTSANKASAPTKKRQTSAKKMDRRTGKNATRKQSKSR